MVTIVSSVLEHNICQIVIHGFNIFFFLYFDAQIGLRLARWIPLKPAPMAFRRLPIMSGLRSCFVEPQTGPGSPCAFPWSVESATSQWSPESFKQVTEFGNQDPLVCLRRRLNLLKNRDGVWFTLGHPCLDT